MTALSRARFGVRGRPRARTKRTRPASANLTRTKTRGGAVSMASRFTMNVDPRIAGTGRSTRGARGAPGRGPLPPPPGGKGRREEPPRADGPDPPRDALARPRLGRGPVLPERARRPLPRGRG